MFVDDAKLTKPVRKEEDYRMLQEDLDKLDGLKNDYSILSQASAWWWDLYGVEEATATIQNVGKTYASSNKEKKLKT